MLSKLHRNAILTGSVDCYCLACESHLWSEQDAYRHTEKPIHEKNLALCPYLERYSTDRVRNVKKGYYCECCNAALPTMVTVGLHVTESEHAEKKMPKLVLTRLGNDVLVDDKVLISNSVWNGIMDEICAVCNIEIDEEIEIHTTKRRHVLNLIQKKVEYIDGGVLYRKVDGISFHCLVCNMIFPITSITTHSTDKNHMQNMQWHEKRQETYNLRLEMINNEDTNSDGESQPRENNEGPLQCDETESLGKSSNGWDDKHKEEPSSSLNDNAMNDGNTKEFKTESVFLNKQDIDIQKHTDDHDADDNDVHYSFKDNTEDKEIVTYDNRRGSNASEMSRDSDVCELENMKAEASSLTVNSLEDQDTDQNSIDNPENYAAENEITYNKDDRNAFCRLCKVRMPSSIENMKEHVMGNKHKKNLGSIQRVKNVNPVVSSPQLGLWKISSELFIHSLIGIKNSFMEDEFVINETYCLTEISFVMIALKPYGLRCLCCAVNIPRGKLGDHLDTSKHNRAVKTALVVASLEEEFMREVATDSYHCGYCNSLISKWEEVSQHLTSMEHLAKKNFARARLATHLPDIRMHRALREMAPCNVM